MTTHPLVDALVDAGVTLAVSLPDSWLAPVLDALDEEPRIRHLPVTREDDGVAMVAGAAVGGATAVLVCQNAGLLLSTNALAGYGGHHGIGVPVIAALRGGPDDGFFYQAYKGRTTGPVLDAIDVPNFVIDDPGEVDGAARVVTMASLHRRPAVALLTRRALLGGTT